MSRYAYVAAFTGLALLGASFSTLGAGESIPGNRYKLPADYHSEISAAEAYLNTSGRRHLRWIDWVRRSKAPRAVILDVRTVQEHLDGHPPGAYSIPFPRVQGKPGDIHYIGYDVSTTPEKVGFGAPTPNGKQILGIARFAHYVQSVLPDKNTHIYTLCASGYRSVQAANVLANAGYKNVRNIWAGYKGLPKYAYTSEKPRVPANPPVGLDLDNDNVVEFLVEGEKKVDSDDLDGWAYFQRLPTTTHLRPDRIDIGFAHLYY